MSDFGELLQAAEQLTAEFDPSSSSDLPRVERNLHQIVEAGQQLFAKTSRDVGSQDVKAAILLGSRGIDLPSITNKLESISTGFATATEPTEPLRDTDVIGFLRYNSITFDYKKLHILKVRFMHNVLIEIYLFNMYSVLLRA